MDFQLSREQEEIQALAREFAQAELAPIAAALDRESRFPRDLFRKMGDLGFLGLAVPEEYGGNPVDFISGILVGEEIGHACCGTALSWGAHAYLCAGNLARAGTEEQKKKYLPRLASGEWIGALAITEPEAGSDAVGMRARARRTSSGGWVLDGTKTFITNGSAADLVLVFAKTGAPESRELSCFAVERGTPGFTCSKDFEKMGLRASPLTELSFAGCELPAGALIGEAGKGVELLMEWLDRERIGMGGLPLGLARAAFEAALAYSRERHQFGVPIASFQMVKEMLADMAVEIDATRLLAYRAAWLADRGVRATLEASKAKLFAAEMVMRVTTKAVQVFGGYGYVKDFPVERYMRDAKLLEIGGGTSQIQRLIIADHVLGLGAKRDAPGGGRR
jgi:alkylation response protein AidB-like acyl-CoA dehydrogenase